MQLSHIHALNAEVDRVLVTCALPYVNNVPHLGNMVPLISADAYARFLKRKGVKSIYICATDEHGTRTEIEAAKAGLDEDTYCQQIHARMLEVFRWFHVDFTHFGRTSCAENHALTQELFLKAEQHGAILEQEIKQLYSAQDEMFLPDSYVLGTCPYCGYDKAQGDQCSNCGRLLDGLQLINPRSRLSGAVPEVRATKHLFLRLDALSPRLKAWLEAQTHWEGIIRNLPLGWIAEGLQPRAITRDLRWGVRVPKAGYEDKVFYVWFDAPIGYIGATAEWVKQEQAQGRDERLEAWWKGGRSRVVHFLGKDNVPFHTLMWPATLLAADDGWNLPSYIASNEYLTYEGDAFSKSRGVGVFSEDAVKTGIPADAWRYYILANRPEKRDVDFSFKDFQTVISADLVGNLGNLVNRVMSFTAKHFGEVPAPGELWELDRKAIEDASAKAQEIEEAYGSFELRQAARLLLDLGDVGNRYFQAAEPWRWLKEDRARCATVLHTGLSILHKLMGLAWPILPERAEVVFAAMGSGLGQELEVGAKLQAPPLLFQHVDDATIQALTERYGSKQEAAVGPLEFEKDPAVSWPCVILELDGVEVKKKVKSIRTWVKEETDKLDLAAIEARADVRAYDALLQAHDKGARHSVQNLIELVRREGKLPTINGLVDIYNLYSLREGLVMGAYDRKAIRGKLLYAVATGAEHFYPVKGAEKAPIHAGEWVLKDEADMVVTRVASKQAEAVAVTEDTTRCAMCIQGNPETPLARLVEVSERMGAELTARCGGTWRLVFAG